MGAIADAVTLRRPDGIAERRVADVLARVHARLAGQDLGTERHVLDAVRAATPDSMLTFWDVLPTEPPTQATPVQPEFGGSGRHDS